LGFLFLPSRLVNYKSLCSSSFDVTWHTSKRWIRDPVQTAANGKMGRARCPLR
jgi:hypothetical protein